MSVTIYHNPRCSKSRETLALLEEKGIQPTIELYLQQHYSVEALLQLANKLGLDDVRKMMRTKDELYQSLGLDNPALTNDDLLKAISENSALLERPIVVKGEKAKEAEAAGADYVGDSELAQKIQGGWFEFDVIVATPDMMGEVGRLGRVLGPKGLMPNPKTGTVTMDVTKAVEEIKAGKVTYRVDKAGNIHVPIGKVSFSDEKLVENFKTIHETLLRIKPATVKGQYVRNVAVTTTFGPGVKVDVASL